MKKVGILWAIVPSIIALVLLVVCIAQIMYVNNTVKPYVDKQNKALDEYVIALSTANANTTYNGVYVLEQLKLVASNDPAQQKEGFANIVNFKSKSAVMPPSVPEKIKL